MATSSKHLQRLFGPSAEIRLIQGNRIASGFGVGRGGGFQNRWPQGVEAGQIITLGGISWRLVALQDFRGDVEFDLEHAVISGKTDATVSVVETAGLVREGNAHC